MKKTASAIAGILMATQVHAFGFGDVLSAGINVAGKLGGAAIDKAMEDSPEEMEAKRAKEKEARDNQFKDAVAKVETRSDLKPLEKERMVRQIANTFGMAETFSNMSSQQEIARRQQRDQMLTLGGAAGVVGNAAMNTPSVAMARADMAVKAGEPQAQSRNALAQTDALLKTGQVQDKNRATMAAADGMLKGSAPQSTMSVSDAQSAARGTSQQQAQISNAIQDSVALHQPEMNAAQAAIDAAKPKQPFATPESTELLAQDKGRKIFVEFLNGKSLTSNLQQVFKNAGFTVVDNAKDADVLYQFDGDYTVDAAYERDGLTEQMGPLTDNPHAIEAPQRKAGLMTKTLGGFLNAVGRPVDTTKSGAYKQKVLIVANRRFEEKDMRVSATASKESMALEPDAMINGAMQDVLSAVGIHPSQPVQLVMASDKT